MVHVQSKYPINLSNFTNPGEIVSYWFGYLRARAYIFKNRNRLRCRAPISDIKHLYQLSKDLGTFKAPRKISSKFGQYVQLIIDNKELCILLKEYGWYSLPNDKLDWRHATRGLMDGCGSISRNGRGKQAKYLRIAFYSKDINLLKWITTHLGHREICKDHISWVGRRAIEICQILYLNQSRYLERKLSVLSNEIFKKI